MSNKIDRRKWLRTGLLAAGSIPVLPSFLQASSSSSAFACYENQSDDSVAFEDLAVEIKARLSANENPFGPSNLAKKAIEDALASSYQYSFGQTGVLMKKIADFEAIKPENIMLGSGSSPLLLAAAIHFSKNGGNIISGDPSYDDLPSKAARLNGKWVKVPLTSDYQLDLAEMEKKVDANTSLVYICNPNNPTACALDTTALRSFCERVSEKVPILIDEAYIDYLPDPKASSMMDLIAKGKNIIIARTFSKLYGFAGLRVGYCAAQPAMIRQLSLYTPGAMGLSNTSLQAAIASYQDTTFLNDALQKTDASKQYLYGVLKQEGYDYIPSHANFVLFPIKMEGRQFVAEMSKRGVSIRSWQFNNKHWCRVSIGRMDEMQAFAAAFKEIS